MNDISAKPILFRDEMVKVALTSNQGAAILLIKPQPKSAIVCHCGTWQETQSCANGLRVFSPLYREGDILYVREAWKCLEAGYPPRRCVIGYRAGGVAEFQEIFAMPTEQGEWKSSAQMPRSIARLFVKVTSVKAVRLHSLSASEVMEIGYTDWLQFKTEWNSRIKAADRPAYGWDVDPWVWIVKYTKISKEEAINED